MFINSFSVLNPQSRSLSPLTLVLPLRSQNGISDAGYLLLGPWLAGAMSLTSLNGFEGLDQVDTCTACIEDMY
jgi:hypothetical protein